MNGAFSIFIYLRAWTFGARYYDPFTARWMTLDPLAGKQLIKHRNRSNHGNQT